MPRFLAARLLHFSSYIEQCSSIAWSSRLPARSSGSHLAPAYMLSSLSYSYTGFLPNTGSSLNFPSSRIGYGTEPGLSMSVCLGNMSHNLSFVAQARTRRTVLPHIATRVINVTRSCSRPSLYAICHLHRVMNFRHDDDSHIQYIRRSAEIDL